MKKTLIITFILVATFFNTVFAIDFSDIQNHWGKTAIEWAISQGMVEGYPDGTFKPNKQVTEAEFLTLLIRAYKELDEVKNPQHWADRYYKFADLMNYPTSGLNDLDKRNYIVTRGHVAEIVAGTQGVNYSGDDAIHYLLAYGLAKGKDPNEISIKSFGAEDTLTRAEAVQFIKNLKENGSPNILPRPEQPSDPSDLPPLEEETKTEKTYEYSDELLPADPVTQPAIDAFVESIKLEGNKVTGVVPEIPEGHTIRLSYTDLSDGEWGIRENDFHLDFLKSFQTFEFPYEGEGGFVYFAIFKGYEGKNEVSVDIPSLKVTWGAERE